MAKLSYRSVFISDVHLGTKNCKADYLLDFLRQTESDYLYLVGDIFDLWEMKNRVHWTNHQSDILQELFQKAQEGTKVIYIPGNHDAWFRKFAGSSIRGIELQLNAEHITADGRRFLVSHGDEFDTAVRHNRILKYIGDYAYNWLLLVGRFHNKMLKRLQRPYWSLSAWIKTRVGNAKQYIEKFESVAAESASQKNYDGYICGHIHKAGIRKIGAALYCNDGDWVEHCTALTEDENGWLQLLHWSDHARVEAVNRGEVIETLPFPIDKPVLVPSAFNSKNNQAA